jgi:hypothetical protein
MNGAIWVLALGIFPGSLSSAAQQSADAAAVVPMHVSNSFEFDVRAPMTEVAPLFGPEGERCWSGKHWNPVFFYPQPAKDLEGSVFTVQHGPHTVVWVNTIFDLAGGRMQYVAVIPDAMAFTVDVQLNPAGATATHVRVTYTRTALDTGMNDEVTAMGNEDRENGPHWQRAIESYLKNGSASGCTQTQK